MFPRRTKPTVSDDPSKLRSTQTVSTVGRQGGSSTGLSLFRLKQAIGEASSLAPVQSTQLLDQLRADAACWVVHDEPLTTEAVSLLSVRKDTFSITPVRIETSRVVRATDSESVFVVDGRVTVVGSASIGANGKIDERRAFLATFSEHDVRVDRLSAGSRGKVVGTVTMLGLSLTKAINHAIATSGIELAEPSKLARKAAARAGLVNGQPINIEGATVDNEGRTILGLRSPVSRPGRPLIVRLEGDMSEDLDLVASATVHEIELEAVADQPVGIRDLAFDEGRLHMVTAPSDSQLLAGRTRRAPVRHLSTTITGDDVKEIRQFGNKTKVEGLARPHGAEGLLSDGWWYVIDNEKAVIVLSAH